MKPGGAIYLLDDLGTLRFAGAEAGKFLQGQLSNDIEALTPGRLLRAGLHNPQGRTLALLGLMSASPPDATTSSAAAGAGTATATGAGAGAGAEDILAVLPQELLSIVAAHLRRYVLRTKVTISDESARYRILGVVAGGSAADATADGAGELPGLRVDYALAHERRLLLLQDARDPAPPASMPRQQWRALDVAAGLPQVYSATSGQFVAQMLNLDCIDAISFTKGCYTGQEVIARAHYRGRIKRRLQRFVSATALQLAAGDAGRLDDGRSFRVVDATQRADGSCEFLAVAGLAGAVPEADDSAQLPAEGGIAACTLPLPYALPD